MGNETEKNQQNPGQRQDYPGNATDLDKKNPSQKGEHVYDPQDPFKRKPGQDTGTDGPDREESEDVEKRRAS